MNWKEVWWVDRYSPQLDWWVPYRIFTNEEDAQVFVAEQALKEGGLLRIEKEDSINE